MALITQPIPDLYSGVSQLPAVIRPEGAAEDAVNTFLTVGRGLRKRPPTEHQFRLSAPIGNAHIHHINRDVSERYVVVLTDGDLKVYDINTGQEKSVAFPDGKAYLDVNSARDDFALVTVADYTFVVNKTRVCALNDVAADQTAQPFYYQPLNRNDGDGLYEPNFAYGAAPTFSTVQAFTDLPKTPAHGALYKITGSTETSFVSYYVVRNGGVWDETVAPGLRNAIDASTMPHALVRQPNGSFTFAPFSWKSRPVGDESTNPAPTFIGRTIRDVFYFQNRLALTVDENTVMSAVGDFGNFWRRTVLDALEADVLDLAADDAQVSILNYAIPFREDIMLFSDQSQFIMSTQNGGLSGSSVSLSKATAYETAPAVRPVALGSDVYFASESGGYVTLREYQFDRERQSNIANDLTATVDRYIPAGVRKITPSVDNSMLTVSTAGAPASLFTYRFFYAGGRKLQSAWSRWDFSGDIISSTALGQYLFLVINRADGLYLERLDLYPEAEPAGYGGQVFLDRRASPSARSYDNTDNRTTLTIPYPVTTQERSSFRIVAGPGAQYPGALIDPTSYTWIDDTRVRIPGNWLTSQVLFGLRYTMTFTFSPFFMRRPDGTAVQSGRLQLRTMRLSYEQTAYFRVQVQPKAGPSRTETILPGYFSDFTGKTIGDAGLILGRPIYASGSYRFPVRQQSGNVTITIINDSHVNSEFYSAEWEAEYVNRARI